jgi:predicted SnoaL-like aldol condensation-catalyzing enzyme
MTPKQVASNLFTAVFTDFDEQAAADLLDPDYIQHNPIIPTGAAPLLGFLPALKESGIAATTHRIISEGDVVVLHNTYTNADAFGGETMVAFDIIRVDGDKAVEHWDNLQAPPATTASGRSMTDGPTEVTDLHLTAENKALVSSFLDEVFLGGAVDKAGHFITDEPGAYHQHNPLLGDGLDTMQAGLAALAETGLEFSKVHRVVAEGNFVFSVTEGRFGGEPAAFFDLWRVQDGRIVEHWDVIEQIPAEMAHDNGKF